MGGFDFRLLLNHLFFIMQKNNSHMSETGCDREGVKKYKKLLKIKFNKLLYCFCMRVRVYVCVSVSECMYVNVCVYACVCVCAWVCTCVSLCVYIRDNLTMCGKNR